MSPTSRRITLYWLLLLVPTLLVGAAAIQLLRREEQRLARQSEQAVEARRAAMETQTRLAAENVELLIDDVQQGLFETLETTRGADVDAVLAEWRAVNPLVRGVFRGTAAGEVLWPSTAGANEEVRAFLRRVGEVVQRRPWQHPVPTVPTAAAAPTATQRKATANLAQVQSARRDVQQLLRESDYVANSVTAEDGGRAESARRTQAARATLSERARNTAKTLPETRAESSGAFSDSDSLATTHAAAAGGLRPSERTRSSDPRTPPPAAAASDPRPSTTSPAGQRGWTALANGAHRHLFGWVVLTPANSSDDEVRGVELEIQALMSRLAGALPREVEPGEVYELRDPSGRAIHRVGQVVEAGQREAFPGAVRPGSAGRRPADPDPAVRTALSNPLFQGWEVVGFAPEAISGGVSGSAFFWVGALLVAIFLAAIVTGGSLLLWQARRSEADAAQRTSFVANVSHEFKTPLTTIRLFAELLEQGRVRDDAQCGEYLRTIERETQRLARLVNNVLDFSRLEQGRKKFAREPFDLAAELSRLLDTHAARLADAGLLLRRDFPGHAVEIVSDRDAIEQIVLNLMDNAAKYGAGGGELGVTVSATPEPDRKEGDASAHLRRFIRVTVADRGPGVPPEHRERIFEQFHRVDETLTAEKAGAGLGLSIARQLARGLGGELRYNDRPGGGAMFTLELPLPSA